MPPLCVGGMSPPQGLVMCVVIYRVYGCGGVNLRLLGVELC